MIEDDGFQRITVIGIFILIATLLLLILVWWIDLTLIKSNNSVRFFLPCIILFGLYLAYGGYVGIKHKHITISRGHFRIRGEQAVLAGKWYIGVSIPIIAFGIYITYVYT